MKFKIEIYGNILLTCLRHIKLTFKNLSKSFFLSPSKTKKIKLSFVQATQQHRKTYYEEAFKLLFLKQLFIGVLRKNCSAKLRKILFSQNAEKYGQGKTLYLDTFHAVLCSSFVLDTVAGLRSVHLQHERKIKED